MNKPQMILSGMTIDEMFLKFEELLELKVAEALAKAKEPETDKLLTTVEVCQIFSVSRTTINNWCGDGKLTPHYMGGRKYFRQSEVMNATKALTKVHR